MNKKKTQKIFNTVKNVVVWLVVIVAVAMMIFTIFSVTTLNRNDRNIFGYRIYIVNSDSMAATDFKAGSLIFVKEVDPSTLEAGDIITFISQNTASFNEVVTHKVRKVTRDAEGNPGFITYGTTTDVDDDALVTYAYILGKYQGNIPFLGSFFNFMKTTVGYFVCIFIPFVLIILYEGIRFFTLFRRYKKEQMEEMEAEKVKLQAEREENAKMIAELKALKAQLESKSGDATDSKADSEESANGESDSEE